MLCDAMNCLFPVTYRIFIHLKHFSRDYHLNWKLMIAGDPVIPVMDRTVKVTCWVLVMFSRMRKDYGRLYFLFFSYFWECFCCLWVLVGSKLHGPCSWVTVSLFVSFLHFQVLQRFLGFPAKNCSPCLLLVHLLVELLFLRKRKPEKRGFSSQLLAKQSTSEIL